MSDKALVHDAAWAAAARCVAVFAGCLRDEERVEAFRAVYPVLRAAMEQLLVRHDRQAARHGLRPPTDRTAT